VGGCPAARGRRACRRSGRGAFSRLVARRRRRASGPPSRTASASSVLSGALPAPGKAALVSRSSNAAWCRRRGTTGYALAVVSLTALTSAEISLPVEADGVRVSDRIAVLADTVDVVGLTDNHAGQPRMSPLAAVALAREQGVGTVVHVSCRDRNRLALQSQVVGAAALGAEAVLCMQGDPVPGIEHVADMTATQLIASASAWSAPHPLAVGAVVNPFSEDVDRELRLLRRKIAAGATFVQSQMIFDLGSLEAFLSAAEDILADVRFYASVGELGRAHMAERACALPGVTIPQRALAQIGGGGRHRHSVRTGGLPCQDLARRCASRISARSRGRDTRCGRGVPNCAGCQRPAGGSDQSVAVVGDRDRTQPPARSQAASPMVLMAVRVTVRISSFQARA
jgi:methylenetetrahydrofolate reductase (NADPH)